MFGNIDMDDVDVRMAEIKCKTILYLEKFEDFEILDKNISFIQHL